MVHDKQERRWGPHLPEREENVFAQTNSPKYAATFGHGVEVVGIHDHQQGYYENQNNTKGTSFAHGIGTGTHGNGHGDHHTKTKNGDHAGGPGGSGSPGISVSVVVGS